MNDAFPIEGGGCNIVVKDTAFVTALGETAAPIYNRSTAPTTTQLLTHCSMRRGPSSTTTT